MLPYCAEHEQRLQVFEVGQRDWRRLISARWQDLSFQADVKGMSVCLLKIRQGLRSLTWSRTPADALQSMTLPHIPDTTVL